MSNIWRKGLMASAIAFLVLLTAGLLWPTGSANPASADGDAADVSDALKDALTVTSVNVDCPDRVIEYGGSTQASGSETVVVFRGNIGALKGTPPRKWSDAITTPYVQTEPAKMLEETQAEVCFNPHYGVTLAHFFAHMEVGDVKIVDLNPWLQPFAVDAGEINDQAAGYMPLLDATSVSDEQARNAITQNVAWQRLAEKIGTLLTRFQLGEIGTPQSVLNYHLTGGGASVGGLPEVGLNDHQEDLPALLLRLTQKDACVPIKVIGFNTGDKRPEEFAPPTCETPAPPPPPATTAPPPTTPPPPGKIRVCRPGVGIIDIREDERRRGDTTDLSKCVPPVTTTPPPTTPPTTPPPTTPPPTQPPCPSGKCTPPTTVAPPPTTAPPPSSPEPQPSNGGQGDSGDGATNTTSPPTTESPAPAPDNTSPPSSNPPPPPG